MATNIKLKRSAVPGKAPLTENLQFGEIAINTYDGILYFKKDDSTEKIVTLADTSKLVRTLTIGTRAGSVDAQLSPYQQVALKVDNMFRGGGGFAYTRTQTVSLS